MQKVVGPFFIPLAWKGRKMNDRNNERTGRTDPATGRVVEEERIPLVEERIAVDRKERKGRTISVSTRPITEEVKIAEPIIREKVSVERVPVGEVVDKVPDIREDGDLTVIPVVEERVTVSVELVLTEEVHLRRTRTEEVDEQTVTRTRTEVVIDED